MSDDTLSPQKDFWKPIPRCEGYFASNHGRIKGPRIIYKGHVDPKGYVRVSVIEDGKRVYRNCSILVARAFKGESNGLMTLHKNGNPADNRPRNLKYGNAFDNYEDSRKHNTNPTGERHGMCKLTLEQVSEIRNLYKPGIYGYRRISAIYNIHEKSVSNIVKGKLWKTV